MVLNHTGYHGYQEVPRFAKLLLRKKRNFRNSPQRKWRDCKAARIAGLLLYL